MECKTGYKCLVDSLPTRLVLCDDNNTVLRIKRRGGKGRRKRVLVDVQTRGEG